MSAQLAAGSAPWAPGPERVLLVVDSLESGGAERHVVELATALRGAGREVTVACSVGGPLGADLAAWGIPVLPLLGERVKRRFSPAFADALRALLAERRFDLVHAHVHASATAAAAALADDDLPLVVTEHTEAPWRGPADLSLARAAYRRAGHVVAVSRAIRWHLIRRLGVPAGRVTYVPNAVAVDPPEAGSAGAGAALAPRGGPLIGAVCRLQPEKGVDVFLRAAAVAAQELPEARFAVIGDGPLRRSLTRLARELGLRERVRFLGHRPDARSLMARLDVLAVSSITDGSPLVILEAMTAGTPIVASACGGIPDQVRDGVDGLLVPPGAPGALAAALVRVARDGGLAARLAASGRHRARTEFSFAAMLARVEAAYASALAAREAGWRIGGDELPAELAAP
jgi:glycosyltransferase involved in cell wall biosynthesis